MLDKSQKQDIGNNSKGFNAGRDAIDNSTTIINYGNSANQELIDYEIISEIFSFLFNTNLPKIDLNDFDKTNSLTHLKEKIPLNFSAEGEKDVKEIFTKLWDKKSLVEKYVKEENDDNEKIEGLVLKFREYFIKLRKSSSHEIEVKDVSIFYELANYCIPEEKSKDSRFLPNAMAIVVYFFESCDFGKRTKTEKENNASLF